MRRPFISWDGEGYTDEWGQHHYWLLANSVGDKLIAPQGRSLERWNIARVFHSSMSRIPDAIHVGFALGYDFTMQLRANGLTDEQRESLKVKQYMLSDDYMWRVMMGKQLTTWLDTFTGAERFNLQDTWGFFQRSFVKANDEYFGETWPHRDLVIEMKKKRSTFTRGIEEDVKTQEYNDIELELHVSLMEELRNRLFAAGLPISRWYGPGAIANGLLQRWKIKSTIIDLYKEAPNIAAIAQHAYAGGRFELVKPGHVNGRVYQYDVNSAYPYALLSVPDLKNGHWKHIISPRVADLPPFTLVRIRWNTHVDYSHMANAKSQRAFYPQSIPFPLWRRTPDKTIHFPETGIHGWYWLNEVVASINYSNTLPAFYKPTWEVEEAYAYYPSNRNERPFSQIEVLYRNRQKLKAIGNGAHIGIKLGLNSLYGKFAQQIGYTDDNGRLPPYHNLAIAGYITATCRAMMIDAMAKNPDAIIAFETDGIFSTEPLDLEINTGLGGWDLTTYRDMYYFQSGFRFGIDDNGDIVKPATRGIPVEDISLENILDHVRSADSVVPITNTRFITLAQAYAWNKPHLAGQWRTAPRKLQLMLESPHGKRIHEPDCPACVVDRSTAMRSYQWDRLHLTQPKTGYEGTLSVPHAVLWNPLTVERGETDNADELLVDEMIMP